MDPVQLQLMQQMAAGQVPGIPGMQAPLTIGGGASRLMMMSDPNVSEHYSPIAGNMMPDMSPLAPFQPMLNQFGMPGALAGLAGNAALTSMMERAGVMPMGNAGSYMQAHRTRAFQQMQKDVSAQVAGQDAEGIYRTFRGGAALMGMPFNREQREAARSMANTFAEFGPTLAMAAPGLLDAMSGERGSVQAMAGQMMDANRYRVDPLTGQMGYGTEANSGLVEKTFENLFAGDNVARMQGLRAGEMGQLYHRLAPEGLMGSHDSLRDRTLLELNRAREADQLDAIGVAADVKVGGNLAELSNADLSKLRGTDSMRARMTDADARKISDQLQDYVGTISAIREVFGENGNPNAAIPQLINALETLTSGQMHKFDSARLGTMVRDMQALTQMSGKSIDQYVAMNAMAADHGNQLGIGTTFSQTATNVGITTGMAFSERAGATGFGALDRQGAEQASISLFNRGMASEMGNAMGALGRIEQAGGFAKGEKGDRLRAIMAAARAGANTYLDPVTKEERNLPTQEAHFRALITAGGVDGMSRSDFNMMLGDRTSNLRMMHSDPALQQAAFNNQAREINKHIGRQIGNRLSTSSPLMSKGLSTKDRNAAARSMGLAATSALSSMSPEEIQDTRVRNRTVADALKAEAKDKDIELSDEEALTMAAGSFGQAEKGAQRFGFESYTAFSQVFGEGVTQTRNERAAQATARAGVNEAMSGLGPQGTLMQRIFTATQKQGDEGGAANLNTLLQDIFGTDKDMAKKKLMPQLQEIVKEKAEIDRLRGEMEGATPEELRDLNRDIKERTINLEAKVAATQDIGRELGIGGGEETFNREDMVRSRKATRNLKNFNRIDQVRLLAAEGNVTDTELAEIGADELTQRDFAALGARKRKGELALADKRAAGALDQLSPQEQELYGKILMDTDQDGLGNAGFARQQLRKSMREQVKSADEYTAELSDRYSGGAVGQLSPHDQKAIARNRRASKTIAPTKDAIDERKKELSARNGGGRLSDHEMTIRAEEHLIAENQLRSLGLLSKDQSLLDNTGKFTEMIESDPELRNSLSESDIINRGDVVTKYLENRVREKFYGKTAVQERNRLEANDQLGTAEGRRSLKETEANLATMADTRREFLMDKEATTRLGGRAALDAVTKSRNAELDLQRLANKYYDGSPERMLVTGGLGMSDKGQALAEKEFKDMNSAQRKDLAERMGVDEADLTVAHYKDSISEKGKRRIKDIEEANEAMAGGVDNKARAAGLGVTVDQLESLQKIIALENTDPADVKKLGLTEAEYWQTIEKGVDKIGPALRLFKGEGADTKLKAAQSDAGRLEELQVSLGQTQASLAKQKEIGRKASPLMLQKEADQKKRIKVLTQRRNKSMEAVGLNPKDEEDIKKYNVLLENQDAVDLLESRHKAYKDADGSLRAGGMDAARMGGLFVKIRKQDKEANEELEEIRKLDLGHSGNAIAEGFGISTEVKSDELASFKKTIEGGGESRERNLKMVAGVLDKVKDLKIAGVDDDATSIEKLDALTDEYDDAGMDSEKRKRLAKKYGMSVGELDNMMNQTDFMDMELTDEKYTQENWDKALAAVGDKDVAAQVAKEDEHRMTITGVLELFGELSGEGTLTATTGSPR